MTGEAEAATAPSSNGDSPGELLDFAGPPSPESDAQGAGPQRQDTSGRASRDESWEDAAPVPARARGLEREQPEEEPPALVSRPLATRPRGAAAAPVGRTLPHSLEAEEYLLSCCMLDAADVVPRCEAAGIGPASFYDPKHAILFDCIASLHRRGLPSEAANVAEELKTTRQLEQVGGFAFLAQVTSRIPTTAQAGYFIEKVKELAVLREVIRSATLAVENAYAYSGGGVAEHMAPALSLLRSSVEDRFIGARKNFTVWRPSQFIAYELDPSARLLGDGFLERGEWTSLVGIGGLGKTRLALWMALCQILSRPWCGIPTNGAPQRWIILSTENGISRWREDLLRMTAAMTPTEVEAVDTHLLILALTPDEEGDLCLGNPDSVSRLKATLADSNPGVVVFDPFADLVDGDESKTADMVETLRKLRSVTRSSCPAAAILVIHHARTGSSNVVQAGDNFNAGNFGRGAKALYSRVRCELQLAPQDRDDPTRLVLACGKANNGPKFPTRGIVFNPDSFGYEVDPSFDVDAWRADVAGKRSERAVAIADVVDAVRELAVHPGDETTTKLVASTLEDTGASIRTIQRQLKTAVAQGYLRPGKKRGYWKLGGKPLPN